MDAGVRLHGHVVDHGVAVPDLGVGVRVLDAFLEQIGEVGVLFRRDFLCFFLDQKPRFVVPAGLEVVIDIGPRNTEELGHFVLELLAAQLPHGEFAL